MHPFAGSLRSFATLVGGAACYGAAIGAGKNLTYVWRSAVKVPLLLLGTAMVCALSYHVMARFLGVGLRFLDVQRATLRLFRDAAAMLASLSPVTLFLARTMQQPHGDELRGYPGFVVANVAFVALAGAVALLQQLRALLGDAALPRPKALALAATWLLLSLVVGGQLAFWLRPFFGISSLTGAPPFVLGDEPTSTGARSFYEAVWQFASGV
ncbi:MAG: hypothetical protein H6835_03400 [Planctomycetes bacterium]|nr:hypothetical protein [Planctomycetota bacterium]